MKIRIEHKLYLRKIKISDAWDVFEFASDSYVVKFLTYSVHQNIYETRKIIKKMWINNPDPYASLGISYRKKIIGTANIAKVNGYWELGYQLNKAYHGKKIAQKSISALLTNYFKDHPKRTVHVWAHNDNAISWHIIKKLGFVISQIEYTKLTDENKKMLLPNRKMFFYVDKNIWENRTM